MAFFLELFPVILKLILMVLERTKATTDELRRKKLAEFDASLDKAKAGDARSLSQWLGKNL